VQIQSKKKKNGGEGKGKGNRILICKRSQSEGGKDWQKPEVESIIIVRKVRKGTKTTPDNNEQRNEAGAKQGWQSKRKRLGGKEKGEAGKPWLGSVGT